MSGLRSKAPTIQAANPRKRPIPAHELLAVFLMLWPLKSFAQSYDAAADFANRNPNGVWSYGIFAPDPLPDPASFSPYSEYRLFTCSLQPADFKAWLPPDGHPACGGHPGCPDPDVIFNDTSTVLSCLFQEPGELSFHPGPGGEYSVVRWTAPEGGLYSVDAAFRGLDPRPTTTEVTVLHGSTLIGTLRVEDYRIEHPVSARLNAQTGDTVDVAVSPMGNFYNDTTGLDILITKLTSCLRGNLVPPAPLLGVKAAGAIGARFEWGQDPNAEDYHLNTVTGKRLLRETDPTSPRQMPVGQGEAQCTTSNLSCTDADAIVDPRGLLFYQVLSACGSSGADEGPVCAAAAPCP